MQQESLPPTQEQPRLDLQISQADWETCLRVLRACAETPAALDLAPEQEPLERLVARIYKRVRKERRRGSARKRKGGDRELVSDTGRVRLETPATAAEAASEPVQSEFTPLKSKSRSCYICRERYREVHHFYHLLCPACANWNFAKRIQQADLSKRYALVTGGRIKIGFQTALKLLRWGANVTVTTRFPKDAVARFAAEPDFDDWRERLCIREADFRDVPAVLRLVESLNRELPALEILINNAAQSVRRSADYLLHRRQFELGLVLPPNQLRLLGVDCSAAAAAGGKEALQLISLRDAAALDRHGELLDTREAHSWTQRLADVEPLEVVETLLINANAPLLLASGLKGLFVKSPFADRYIVNVTGLDGQFGRGKPTQHPHVNMSKAALNMLTRTSAADYSNDRIYMNSVDTGWITLEGAYSQRVRLQKRGFVPPLDEVDGAARILDPIATGINGAPTQGCMFRNYRQAGW